MRKAKEIIGLSVITFRTGRRVAKVHDILFDPAQNRMLALLTDEGGWFTSAKVIPAEHIKEIGPDAVVIEDERAIVHVSSNRQIQQALERDKVITHTRVFTEDGRDLGSISDMMLDENTGEVLGYEVTGGLFADTLRGKKFMPAPATMTMGRDVTFVPSTVGDQMETEVTGGIQKGLTEAQKNAAAAVGQAQEAGGRATEQAKGYAAQAGEEINRYTKQITEASTEQQRKYLIGKRASTTVRTKEGRVIVREGDKVSNSDYEEARDKGVLTQLVAAVTAGEAQRGGGQVQQGAGEVWGDIRQSFSDLTRGVQQGNEQQRINAALGKPTTRVILDQNDQVILNTGEIITHESIRLARDNGVLDVLLNSAARGETTLTVEQRKAPEEGEANLHHEQQKKK